MSPSADDLAPTIKSHHLLAARSDRNQESVAFVLPLLVVQRSFYLPSYQQDAPRAYTQCAFVAAAWTLRRALPCAPVQSLLPTTDQSSYQRVSYLQITEFVSTAHLILGD